MNSKEHLKVNSKDVGEVGQQVSGGEENRDRPLEQSASEEQQQVSPQASANVGPTTPRGEASNVSVPSSPITPLPSGGGGAGAGNNNSASYRRRGQPPKHNSSPVRNTIVSRASDGSDSRPGQPPSAHPFFNSLYDSDGSDAGSIVFNPIYRQPQDPTPVQQQQQQQDAGSSRDRLASYDTMESSGTLRYVSSKGGSPSPQLSKVSQDKLNKVNPQNLPYDQRRKLMKLKQQQQQQQGQRDPSPPPQKRRPDGGNLQQQQQQQQQQQHPSTPQGQYSNGIPMISPQSPHAYPYGMQPQQIPMQLPPGAYPTPPPNARLSPYRGSPRYDPNRPPAGMKQGGGRNNSRQYAPQQPHLMPQQQGQIMPNQLPPSGLSRPMPPSLRDMRQHPNMTNSGEMDPMLPRLRPRTQVYPPEQNMAPPPPPPPPPPPMPPHHVRAESTGSISSLGTTGSLFGQYDGQEDDMGRQQQSQDPYRQYQRPASGRQPYQTSPREHHRTGSMERPPMSSGYHKRHPSLEQDYTWEDEQGRRHSGLQRASSTEYSSGDSPSSHASTSESTDDEGVARQPGENNNGEAHERTSLLPPSGISSSEQIESKRNYTDGHRAAARRSRRRRNRQQGEYSGGTREPETTVRWNNTTAGAAGQPIMDRDNERISRRQKKKKKKRRSRRSRNHEGSPSSHGSRHSSSSGSSYDYRQWTRRRAQMLEDERARLISQWKAEARAEAMASRRKNEEGQWHTRIGRYVDSECGAFFGRAVKFCSGVEAFICNLPLTVGAISMSIVILGICWFKFAEENLDSCEPVHFHSSQCSFPEFPGCFYCDKTDRMYNLAVNFHFACSSIAGVIALSFILKIFLAPQVFLDEMSSPTTASPAGLICMTLVCVFAGRGFVGQIFVSLASCVHLCLVVYFLYVCLAYHIMPEPSWTFNTIGVGLSAVKCWLYYPMSGHFLMAISLCLNFFFFPISLIRVALNEKISAPVAYMQMSAPSISLYAMSILSQPSFEEEHPDINRFQRAHRLVYLPAMHFLFVLSVIGFLASIQGLAVRWNDFKKREFSPAHSAFCFPTLSHANAIQAYRAALNSFSKVPPGGTLKLLLYGYWVVILIGGTLITMWITVKFFYNLPRWTNVNVEDEREPPAPYETSMTLNNAIATGEALVQPFVSPAVLQANETGALIMVRFNGAQKLVRTRKLPALGFEPTMELAEMERERELLMEWVGKHPPRRRQRNVSVPGIDFSDEFGGVGSPNIYGVDIDPEDLGAVAPPPRRHAPPPSYQSGHEFY